MVCVGGDGLKTDQVGGKKRDRGNGKGERPGGGEGAVTREVRSMKKRKQK